MKPALPVWNTPEAQQFVEALLLIADKKQLQNFLGDVMTEKEITEISARLEAAKMLSCGETYTDIVKATKLSSTTVARISSWMQNGYGGYAKTLNLLSSHHDHTLPARAE